MSDTREGTVAPVALGRFEPRRVLLVEDDPGDALLATVYLDEVAPEIELITQDTLTGALEVIADGVDCVVLDLGLPDAQGVDSVAAIVEAAPTTAVVVLTGLDDEDVGRLALAHGAEDFLAKTGMDGQQLARSIRYAIERKTAEEAARRLLEAELRHAFTVRIERGLLARPTSSDPRLGLATAYRPGTKHALLGGDFLDMVELPDNSIAVLIGDVSGHGADQAALGVSLRIAWRALVLNGIAVDRLLPALDEHLARDRESFEIFATACMLHVAADRRTARVWIAGHPLPLVGPPPWKTLAGIETGPCLGVVSSPEWPANVVELQPGWAMFLYTDGLVEGLDGEQRFGEVGLLASLGARCQLLDDAPAIVAGVIDDAESRHGGRLPDDVAVVLLVEHDR
jgi:serine phosphatase RsbU (regulator of sigma subunit)